MRWIFVPFTSLEHEPSTKTAVDYYKKKYNSYFSTGLEVVYRDDNRSLEGVRDNDMLLIPAHGSHRADKRGLIGVQRSARAGDMETVTANGLAGLLVQKGLPQGHVYIKTLSCCGGGLATADGKTTNFGSAVDECFAAVLAQALYPSHPRIVVGGYRGYLRYNQSTVKTLLVRSMTDGSDPLTDEEKCNLLLDAEDVGQVVDLDPVGGFRVSAKKLRPVWFNGLGAVVPGPQKTGRFWKEIVLPHQGGSS